MLYVHVVQIYAHVCMYMHNVCETSFLQSIDGASLISLDIEVSNYSYDHYCQVFSIEEYLVSCLFLNDFM